MAGATRTADILDDLSALADSTRDRLLLLVEANELTVSELCAVLQLPQSTVSRHLKVLADAGGSSRRADGTSRLYSLAREQQSPAARRLWLLVREQVGGTQAAVQDHRRLQGVLAERRTKSQEFFSSAAGQWDRLTRRALRRPRAPARVARAARRQLGRRRSRHRHGRRVRGARAVRTAGHRGRQFGRDAGRGASPAAGSARPSISAEASSRICRSTMRRSMWPR